MISLDLASAARMEVIELRRALRNLVDAGQVERIGRGRGTRYRLANRDDE